MVLLNILTGMYIMQNEASVVLMQCVVFCIFIIYCVSETCFTFSSTCKVSHIIIIYLTHGSVFIFYLDENIHYLFYRYTVRVLCSRYLKNILKLSYLSENTVYDKILFTFQYHFSPYFYKYYRVKCKPFCNKMLTFNR